MEKAYPAWIRLLVPSVTDLIFVALLVVLVFTPLSLRLLGDAGIGWHIRTGQLILQTRSIPRVDPFSSIMHGKPWFAWEWLYDVAVGAADSSAGLDGVVVLNAAVIALVFSLSFRLLRRRGAGLFLALLLTILAASASMLHFLARPHLLTWLFVVLWLTWLEDDHPDAKNRRLLWLLPASMMVWVNVHGGFLTGFVLLFAFFAGRWVEWRQAVHLSGFAAIRAGARLRTLTIAGLLSALATLVNPYAWHLHVHICRYLTGRWLMDHVQEFQSPNFHDPAARCFMALLAVTVVAFGVRTRPISVTNYLLVLFAMTSGLYSARNVPVAAILLVFVAGPLLSGAAGQRNLSHGGVASKLHQLSVRLGSIDAALRAHAWPVLVLSIIAAVAWRATSGNQSLINAHFDSHRFPDTAVRALQSQADREAVFAPDYWGGYLIYRLYPARQVVVDDRHDFYGEEFFKSYLKTYRFEAGWNDLLNGNHVMLVVAPKDGPLAQGLILDPQWKLTSTDDVAVIFHRVSIPGQ